MMNLKSLALGASLLLPACGSHYQNSFQTVTVTRSADNLVTVTAHIACGMYGVSSCAGPDGICVEARFGTIDASALDAGTVGDAGSAAAALEPDSGVDAGYLVGVAVTVEETVRVCQPDGEYDFVLASTRPVATTLGAVRLVVNTEGGSQGDADRVILIP